MVNNVYETLNLPEWTPALTLIILAIGFPLAIIFSWIFDVTPEGIEKTKPQTGDQKEDKSTVSGSWRMATYLSIVIIVGLIAFNIFGGRNKEDLGSVQERTIAVLPFKSIGANQNDNFLSDGITETIISHLSKMKALRVISRTSVEQFTLSPKTAQEIASDLGVVYLLRGSVQKYEEKLRISVQLVNGQDDYNIWAENYDEDFRDIFTIQSQIAGKIANALKIHISSDEHERIISIPTENLEAYDLYVKGRFFWNKRTEEDLLKGKEYFEEAIVLDDVYAQAWSGLADAYTMLATYNYMSSDEGYSQAKKAANEALKLNPKLAEPLAALGFIYAFYDNEWEKSREAFEQALSFEPSYATAHSWYAWTLVVQGKHELAEKHIELARNLDPLSNIIMASAGYIAIFSDSNDRAENLLLSAIEQNPDFPRFHLWLSYVYWIKGDWEMTHQYLNNAVRTSNRHPQYLSSLGFFYGITDQANDATEIHNEILEKSRERYVSNYDIALTFLGTRQLDRALESFKRACEERDMWIAFLGVDHRFNYLHNNLEFLEILRTTGLDLK